MAENPTIVLTRTYDQSIAFASEFMARTGRQVAFRPAPLIQIRPTVEKLDVPDISALLFTSAEAVRIFQEIGPKRVYRAYSVGATTAAAARAAGFIVESANGDMSDLLELATARHMVGDLPYFYPRGEHVSGDLAGLLNARGTPCVEEVIYRQAQTHLTDTMRSLIAETPVILPVFSPNMARILLSELEHVLPKDLTFLAISPKVAHVLDAVQGAKTTTAEAPGRAAMIRALDQLIGPK